MSNKPPTCSIEVSYFEAGLLIAVIWQSGKKDYLKNVMKQLLEIGKKAREEAGVKVEYLGSTMIRMTDREGNTVIRELHEWEKSGEYER